jgi:DNA-binding PadR family transcriptional regulator
MAGRPLTNPLALPVLALLRQRPMHPYEIASTIRQRHWQGSFKLTTGSLYTVVNALRRAELIEARETARSGRRPERTVYAITEAGRQALRDRLRSLIGQPGPERTDFGAGLTLIAVLPRAEATRLLHERERLLAAQVTAERVDLDRQLAAGLPRLFVLDADFAITLREAELAWVRRLLADMAAGRVPDPRPDRALSQGCQAPANLPPGTQEDT